MCTLRGHLTERDRFAATYLRCKSTGGQRSGELHHKRPEGHDGIQAVVRDVACGPLGCQHPSSELQISARTRNVPRACYRSVEAVSRLVLGCRVHV